MEIPNRPIIQKRVLKLIKEIAIAHNIPEKEVENMFLAQFAIVKKGITEGNNSDIESFKNIRIVRFGVFYTKKNKLQKLIELGITPKTHRKGQKFGKGLQNE